jgi:hypothetical protein
MVQQPPLGVLEVRALMVSSRDAIPILRKGPTNMGSGWDPCDTEIPFTRKSQVRNTHS